MSLSLSKFPFGKCPKCNSEFNSELRNEYHITHCPWCGEEIDDFMSAVDSSQEEERKKDIFCEECGKTIFRGGSWIGEIGKNQPGVCSGPCERHLCGKCGDWDEDGCCPKCALPCYKCPKGKCEKRIDICTNPCARCSMKNECLSKETDIRHKCQAFIYFQSEQIDSRTLPAKEE